MFSSNTSTSMNGGGGMFSMNNNNNNQQQMQPQQPQQPQTQIVPSQMDDKHPYGDRAYDKMNKALSLRAGITVSQREATGGPSARVVESTINRGADARAHGASSRSHRFSPYHPRGVDRQLRELSYRGFVPSASASNSKLLQGKLLQDKAPRLALQNESMSPVKTPPRGADKGSFGLEELFPSKNKFVMPKHDKKKLVLFSKKDTAWTGNLDIMGGEGNDDQDQDNTQAPMLMYNGEEGGSAQHGHSGIRFQENGGGGHYSNGVDSSHEPYHAADQSASTDLAINNSSNQATKRLEYEYAEAHGAEQATPRDHIRKGNADGRDDAGGEQKATPFPNHTGGKEAKGGGNDGDDNGGGGLSNVGEEEQPQHAGEDDDGTPAKDTIIERVSGRTPRTSPLRVSQLHGRSPAPDHEDYDDEMQNSMGMGYSSHNGVGAGSSHRHDEEDPAPLLDVSEWLEDATGECLYETFPHSVDELARGAIPAQALQRTVDFTVRREGFGEIKWPGSTDLTEPDLLKDMSAIVKICDQYVDVYPDEWKDAKKRELGIDDATTPGYDMLHTTLSKRAEVTIVLRKVKNNMETRLKKHCDKKEMQFLSFKEFPQPQWTFEVQHFSRYGFVDDDDDDDDVAMENQNQNAAAAAGGGGAKRATKPPLSKRKQGDISTYTGVLANSSHDAGSFTPNVRGQRPARTPPSSSNALARLGERSVGGSGSAGGHTGGGGSPFSIRKRAGGNNPYRGMGGSQSGHKATYMFHSHTPVSSVMSHLRIADEATAGLSSSPSTTGGGNDFSVSQIRMHRQREEAARAAELAQKSKTLALLDVNSSSDQPPCRHMYARGTMATAIPAPVPVVRRDETMGHGDSGGEVSPPGERSCWSLRNDRREAFFGLKSKDLSARQAQGDLSRWMGRSSRVCWGPNGQLCIPRVAAAGPDGKGKHVVEIHRVQATPSVGRTNWAGRCGDILNIDSGPALPSLYCSTLMIHWGEVTGKYEGLDTALGRGGRGAAAQDPFLLEDGEPCDSPRGGGLGSGEGEQQNQDWPLSELHSSARGINLRRRLQDFVQCPTDALPDGGAGGDGKSVGVSPFLAPDQLVTFAQDQADTDTNVFQKMLTYEAQLWSLLNALWGHDFPVAKCNESRSSVLGLDASPVRRRGDAPRPVALQRLLGISEWLQMVSEAELDVEDEEADLEDIAEGTPMGLKGNVETDMTPEQHRDFLAIIFERLSAHMVEEAAEDALLAGDPRLATLISAMFTNPAGCPRSQEALQRQIQKWDTWEGAGQVEPEMHRIYRLLSGDILGAMRGCRTIEKYTWKRCLGMQLWWGSSVTPPRPDGRLHEDEFTEAMLAFPHLTSEFGFPRAWYEHVESLGTSAWTPQTHDGRPSQPKCMQYMVLCQFCSPDLRLHEVVATSGATCDSLDFKLSWHVLAVLLSVDFEDKEDFQVVAQVMCGCCCV
jgi:hypothetical protein